MGSVYTITWQTVTVVDDFNDTATYDMMVGIIENLVVMITTIIMGYTHVSIAMCIHQNNASKLTNHLSGIYQQASDVTINHGYGSTNKNGA